MRCRTEGRGRLRAAAGRGLDKRRPTSSRDACNDLTLGYGERGRKAVERLMTEAYEKGLIPNPVPVVFAA
jgi:1,4-dihydroxy-6-naphthoate synthase